MGLSVKRTIKILELVAASRDGLTHTELASALGAAKSSIAPILADLLDIRYLVLNPKSKRYQPGAGGLTLAQRFVERLDILEVARPFLRRLRDLTGETTALTVNNGEVELMVAQESSPHPLRPTLEVGAQLPLYAGASGKAVLAFAAEDERDRYFSAHDFTPLTANTTVDPGELRRELVEIRARGVAYGRETVVEGVTGISAAIFGVDGRPIGALIIQVPTSRLTSEKERTFERALTDVAGELSRKLGHVGQMLSA